MANKNNLGVIYKVHREKYSKQYSIQEKFKNNFIYCINDFQIILLCINSSRWQISYQMTMNASGNHLGSSL